MQKLILGTTAILALATLTTGCDDHLITPDDRTNSRLESTPFDSTSISSEREEIPTATEQWNAIARDLIRGRLVGQAQQRMFAYLSLAQYNAAVMAEDAGEEGTRASRRAAVVGASAEVLKYIFPSDAAFIEEQVRAQQRVQMPEERSRDFALGEAVGRDVAASVVGRARGDGFDAVWTGTVPTCPGCWRSSATPALPPPLPLLSRMRPFFMTSGDQFLPPPPPAFGSPEFQAALAEIRHISDTRTAEQTRIAQFWAANGVVFWNRTTAELIDRYRLDERRAAHAFALMNMASMDATIASHGSKFVYWLLRPSHADPDITIPIVLPNFPAYPSNHAAVSGTSAGILAGLFPAERERLLAMGEEAGMSRLYAGIHYRFDMEAGVEIARKLLELARSRDVNGHEPFPL